tara:strand:+ start:1713 stop:3386 length:1674 start_codon:yes stop_codon:yes gene_type:complete
MKKIFLITLLTNFIYCQDLQLTLESLTRDIPTANFGGQTWRGPSWQDSAFVDSVATMCPDLLAFPPSPDLWNWETGWFYNQQFLDTCCVDSIELSWGQANADVLEITPVNFQNALDQLEAEGLYCLNMISSSFSKQLADINYGINNGVLFERIRLGDEMEKAGNELSISHFPTAQDYAFACDNYIDTIRNLLPNTKIAVSAGNYGLWNPRAQYWNEALYDMSNPADAFRWSAFFYLKDSDTIFTTKQLLAYPFDQIPTNESVRGFSDSITELQDYELWVGYNITDNTFDKRYLNRWSLVLMLSASHNVFLGNNLVKDISLFNVGGIFDNWDALDTENNFRKRATGIFASIWNKAKLNKNQASRISSESLIDSVTYFNNNGVSRVINYPKIFGWRFENNIDYSGSVILTNISEDTLDISVDGILSGNVTWEKWSSDSLYAFIDSLDYINVTSDNGTDNITILPFSINVARGNCINDTDNDGICDEVDNCPEDYNPGQEDIDNNNLGDVCDKIANTPVYSNTKKLVTVIDILGRQTFQKELQLLIYNDGTIEKKYLIGK